MKLLKPLPPNRTYEQILNHYLVEKKLANKLKATKSFEERKKIFAIMYDELFEQVPDHSRLLKELTNNYQQTKTI